MPDRPRIQHHSRAWEAFSGVRAGNEYNSCVFVEGLTEAQRRAYTLADNRLGELGEWNWELVEDELADLGDMDFDIDLTGFDYTAHESLEDGEGAVFKPQEHIHIGGAENGAEGVECPNCDLRFMP